MIITLDSIIANFDKKILNKYNIKQISSIDIYNCYELKFKGAKKDLERFYNKYFETGQSFASYIKQWGFTK